MNRRAWLSMGFIVAISGPSQAAAPGTDDINAALADIRNDSILISRWIGDQLHTAVPYNANTGGVVPSQLKLFGVEVGLSGVVSSTKVDEGALDALPTRIISPSTIDTMERLPFPAILAHAKVGLPWGLDAGVRLGGIPEKEYTDDDTTTKVENKLFGLDVRKAVIKEGIGMPGVTLGLSYMHADGDVKWSSPLSYRGQVVVGGNTFNTSSSGTGSAKSEWKTDSIGLEALLHKKLAIFTPYIGARVTHNNGTVDTAVTTAGNLTLIDPSNSSNTRTQAVNETGAAASKVQEWQTHAMVGTEITILPFMRFGLHGDFAGDGKVGAALDLRFQFR